jgi:hypothetical protein
MSLKTLLQKAGEDFVAGIKIVLPFSMAAAGIASIFFPMLGPAMNVAFIAVIEAESHFKDVPKSGPQKMAWALTIAEPLLKQYVPEGMEVESVIEQVVKILNNLDETGAVIPAITGVVATTPA